MPRLELTLEDQLMNDLTALALTRRVSSEALGLEALKRLVYSSVADDSTTDVYERHLAKAMEKVKALKRGTKFSLNGNHADSGRLFTRQEWAAMKDEDGFAPAVFGKRFFQFATDHKDLIEVSDKAGDNKQRYIRL